MTLTKVTSYNIGVRDKQTFLKEINIMKKILAVLLATSSVAVFADTFQDFNNNVYATYNYTNASTQYQVNNLGTGNVSKTKDISTYYNGWGIGGTFQSKNDIWVNANATSGSIGGDNTSTNAGQMDIRAGYAFQFFGNEDSGFQIIPYASFGVYNVPSVDVSQFGSFQNVKTGYSPAYSYGLGVQPEYRLLNSLKVSLALGMSGTQAYGQQSFNYAVTPEVQYDIAKTVMVSVGYTYSNAFNAQDNVYGANGANTVTAKVGYLF